MKKIFITILLSLSFGLIDAQIVLPQIAVSNISGCKIKGTYTPRGEFLKMFPNFLNDGVYQFSYDNVIPGKYGLDYDGFWNVGSLQSFSNIDFPATTTTTTTNLSGIGNIIVQFIGEPNYNSQINLVLS